MSKSKRRRKAQAKWNLILLVFFGTAMLGYSFYVAELSAMKHSIEQDSRVIEIDKVERIFRVDQGIQTSFRWDENTNFLIDSKEESPDKISIGMMLCIKYKNTLFSTPLATKVEYLE